MARSGFKSARVNMAQLAGGGQSSMDLVDSIEEKEGPISHGWRVSCVHNGKRDKENRARLGRKITIY